MADRLASFFNQHQLNASMFFTGTLCNNFDFDENMGGGFLHIVRRGKIKVHSSAHDTIMIDQPSLLLYPRPVKHQFETCGDTDLTCAIVDLDGGSSSILGNALPKILLMPLCDMPNLTDTLRLLFTEAEKALCGQQAAVDRLFEYLLIQLLRYMLDTNHAKIGLLAGLADVKLVKAITAMHKDPNHNWSVNELAEKAGMSRARFAVHFRETVGTTPIDHLTKFRIALAQTLLKKRKPIGLIANEVGYSNSTAFTRAFKTQIGHSPKAWLNAALENQNKSV